MNPRLIRWLLPVVLAVLALVGWQLLHHALPPSRRFLLPDLMRLAAAFRDHGADLLSAARYTALAALAGFGLAAVVSVGASLLLASSALVRAALYPYLMALQMVPVIIIAPILILWVGPGAPSVIIVTFLISFFPLVVNTTQGLLSVDRAHLDLFRMGRASKWQELFLLRAPAALPYFFTGLRISAILAPIGALTADYLVGSTTGGRSGLGITALIFSSRNEIPGLYATALVGCVLGFLLVAIVSTLGWLALRRWHDSYAGDHK
ncbi:MAG: ABC transporter permease subunit [Opitutaceae bacterium]|jgi:NitT/TauT family transport system permease protein|nr:ABC transporter permease subunit [Opitutaceae bacterium]